MELHERLAELGLGEKKARVYLALLQLGTASAQDLARKAGLKRPTVYDLLQDLIAKRLVSETFAGKRRRFSAEPPGALRAVARRQAQVVEELLPELQSFHNLASRKPRIRYYEGVEGVRQVSEELLTVQAKEYCYFGSVKEMVDVLGLPYLEDYVRRRVRAGIVSNAIRVRGKESGSAAMKGGPQNLRNVRFFPRDIPEDLVSLYLFDDKVAITSALKECYGMVIESRELAVLLKAVWGLVWEGSENR